jgi:hypothetical protein
MFEAMAAAGIPRRYTHCMAKFMPQDEWAYADTLCSIAAGSTPDKQQQPFKCTVAGSLSVLAPATAVELQIYDDQQQAGAPASEQPQQQQLPPPPPPQQQPQQQQREQQQDGLLVMPWWLKALAAVVAGDILSRPDTFR